MGLGKFSEIIFSVADFNGRVGKCVGGSKSVHEEYGIGK